ncbi:MAG: sigma 54-interacting transcriptional regulator [Gemmatimonadales bacterium]|nr:sigma 54-interacting transcriptional regulator [Gemmatimonadales bacterium]
MRVVAATNRGASRAGRPGEFHDDLYYRLNVLSIYLPPPAIGGPISSSSCGACAEFAAADRAVLRDLRRGDERLVEAPWPGTSASCAT